MCIRDSYGDTYAKLTSEISPSKRPFDVIRDALMLDDNFHTSTASLWVLRTQIIPRGCNVRLQHFETPLKMGYIGGTPSTRATSMYIFDSSGEHSIGILPIEPSIQNWDDLAARLILKRSPTTGG